MRAEALSVTRERLRAAGQRVTPQRLLVADALATAGRQLTAQELWQRVRRRSPRIGRATVFRTVEALVGAGVARRLELPNHGSGYIACQPEHHAFVGYRDGAFSVKELDGEPLALYVVGGRPEGVREIEDFFVDEVDGDNEEFEVLSDAEITLDGKAVTLEELQPGHYVQVATKLHKGRQVAVVVEARSRA